MAVERTSRAAESGECSPAYLEDLYGHGGDLPAVAVGWASSGARAPSARLAGRSPGAQGRHAGDVRVRTFTCIFWIFLGVLIKNNLRQGALDPLLERSGYNALEDLHGYGGDLPAVAIR